MGAEGFQQAAGYTVGTLAALDSLRSPGGLGRYFEGRAGALGDPTIRAGLTGHPFLSGFLGVGGSDQPLSLGPGGTGPSAPQQVFTPNLPPLAPEAQLKQDIAGAASSAYANATPEQRRQVGLSELGIHPSIADQLAQVGPGWRPVRIGPQGVSLAPTGDIGAPAQPIAGAQGYVRDPVTGRPLRLPAEKTAGDEAKNEFQLHEKNYPAWLQLQKDKAAAVGQQTAARESVKLATLTSTTRTMLETAPSVKHLVTRVRKDMEGVSTGPFKGRWQELWARKIGEDDPGFIKLRTDMDLLSTALQRMHVGARGGQGMFHHFQALLGTGQQSPANMDAALTAIDEYADDKISERDQAVKALRAPGTLGGPPGTPPAAGQDLGDGFSVEWH